MKQYPKIEYFNKGYFGEKVYVFNKEDGTNFRAEYSKKRGWYKFGTKKIMIDINDPNFGQAIPLFLEKYGNDLDSIFRKKYPKVESFVVFGEFLGENSFAGQHVDEDIKDIILFDI